MKKIIFIGLVGVLIGATTPVSALEETTSEVGITFYQSENKTIPMKKVDISTAKKSQMKNDHLVSNLPRTNGESSWLFKVLGIITLISCLFILLKRGIKNEN
ncbi:LPXTG cell wall anchor domain-containing protein [Candidatus Enterococcus mangumiae]|uniref:Gram-positive cocci surface proteins LPxTG domain-containing protein n=1 Tax=Candidatus Enterococcus mangumiae TaxID=2230878 RepID=A0ABZ2T0R1_9ENTE|nr:LPXTG cell wall anchor domain-containing protein [Enterococcus sp. DIV1094]MBO0489941.1 LPXTG cell wall anchor domain-containing protein [Enterococcus sp. DIV1094]